jgi:hypothetical protein
MKKTICSVCGDENAVLVYDYYLCGGCVEERVDDLKEYQNRYEKIVVVAKTLIDLIPDF